MAEEGPLVVGQQLITPVDRRQKRLVTWERRPRPSHREAEQVVKLRCQPLGWERSYSGGDQFDRQRHAFESSAQLGDGGRIGIRELEVSADSVSSIEKERYRRVRPDRS